MRLFGDGELGLQFFEPIHVGRGQLAALGIEPVASRIRLPALIVDVAALRGQHVNLLLHARDHVALLAAACLCRTHGVFRRRQIARLLFGLRSEHFALLVGRRNLLGDVFEFVLGLRLALAPLLALGLQFEHALFDALAALDDIADALFEPGHFERRFSQRPLHVVQFIARGVVRLADRFQLRLAVAQLGHAPFQRVGGRQHFLLDALLLARRVTMLQEPELMQLERALLLQPAVHARDLGLLFQLVEVVVQFAKNVFDAREVLSRVFQAALGLAAALLVFRDASGFFEKQAKLFGLAFDDAADGALADDGVGARPEAGAEEHVLHVASTHGLVVDVVA